MNKSFVAAIVSTILMFIFFGLGLYAAVVGFPTLGVIFFNIAGLALAIAFVAGVIALLKELKK